VVEKIINKYSQSQRTCVTITSVDFELNEDKETFFGLNVYRCPYFQNNCIEIYFVI